MMPAPHIWTEAENEMIRARATTLESWETIGAWVGVTKQCVILQAHRLGVPTASLRWIAARRETSPTAEIITAPDDPDREPLPAGHPETWGIIVAGTCLAGTEYAP